MGTLYKGGKMATKRGKEHDQLLNLRELTGPVYNKKKKKKKKTGPDSRTLGDPGQSAFGWSGEVFSISNIRELKTGGRGGQYPR